MNDDLASTARSTRSLSIFCGLLCLFSAEAYALVIHSHHETAALSRFLMWCPGAAALSTCLILHIPLSRLGWRWPAKRFLWFAYLLPLLYSVPVYVVAWSVVRGSFAPAVFLKTLAATYGLANWPLAGGIGVGLPLLFSLNVVATLIWALGEEIGWRGLLFPLLHKRFGFPAACGMSGVLWAVWHYPGLLWADYNAGTNPVFAVTCFTITVVAMACIMGFLRVCSGSIWPCVLFHASHNTFVQGLFDALTAPVGKASYITSEFGVGLTLTMTAVAFVVLRRRSFPGSVDKPRAIDSGRTN